MDIIFYRNAAGEQTSKTKVLFESNLRYLSHFKCSIVCSFQRPCSWTPFSVFLLPAGPPAAKATAVRSWLAV